MVTIDADSGPDAVDVADGAEADLEERFLRGTSFQGHVDSGRLRFVLTPSPTAEQYMLARRIMPVLLRNSGGRLISRAKCASSSL